MISEDYPILWMNATDGVYGSKLGNTLINILEAEKPIVVWLNSALRAGNFQNSLDPATTYRLSSSFAPWVSTCYADDRWYRIARSNFLIGAYPYDTEPSPVGLFFIMGTGSQTANAMLNKEDAMSAILSPRDDPWTKTQEILSMNYMGNAVRNSNILLGGLARENIIMVPRLEVRNSNNQIIAVSLKEYTAEVQANYPYIHRIFVQQFRYKDETTNATINIVPMAYKLVSHMPTQPIGTDVQPDGQFPHAPTYTGAILRNLSVIFQGPEVRAHSTNSFYVSQYISSTHSNSMFEWDKDANVPVSYTSLDYARRMINSLGLWWAESIEDVADALGFETISPYVHCPFVQSTGDTTTSDISGQDIYRYYILKQDVSDTAYNPDGFTMDGSQAENNPAMSATATQDFIGSSGFTPSDPAHVPVNPDEYEQEPVEDDDDILKPNDESLNPIGAFVNYYGMSIDMLKEFNDLFYEKDGIDWQAIQSSLFFYTNNPSEAMVSLMMFPFDISRLQRTLKYTTIRFGVVEIFGAGSFRALEIQPDTKMILDLGTGYIPHKYNNFLDLGPYTTVNMFVPYCGTIELDPTDLMDKKLNVQMVVDLTTGAAKVIINANDIPIMYQDCQVGASLPYTATQFSQLLNAILSFVPADYKPTLKPFKSYLKYTEPKVNSSSYGDMGEVSDEPISPEVTSPKLKLTSAISGMGRMGFLMGNFVGKKLAKAVSELADPPTITKVGSASPITNFSLSQNVYFVVGRPKPLVGSLYGHTNGYVCYEEAYLRDYSGFTICDNPDLSHIASATEEEKAIIYEYLTTGVFL